VHVKRQTTKHKLFNVHVLDLYRNFKIEWLSVTIFFAIVSVFLVHNFRCIVHTDREGSKITTVVATLGQGPDQPEEVSYSDTKVIGNGSFGVVYQAKLIDTSELVAIKKVLQDKRFKVQIPVVHCFS